MRRIVIPLLAVLVAAPTFPAKAVDHGFDKHTERSIWFQQLKRPDYYPNSCCGEADAYEADIYQRNADGSYDVEITNGDTIKFPDGQERPEIPTGTKVHVPKTKINPPIETQGNPTEHAWLFVSVSRAIGGEVTPGLIYCFTPLPEGS